MMIVLEATTRYGLRLLPWAERTSLGGRKSLVVGWGFLALRLYRHDMYEFGTLIKKPESHWRE